MEFNAADRATKLHSEKGTTVTDLEQQIVLLTEQARVMRLTLDLRRARVYQDLAYLEAQQAEADAARALQENPIRSATGRIVGWLTK